MHVPVRVRTTNFTLVYVVCNNVPFLYKHSTCSNNKEKHSIFRCKYVTYHTGTTDYVVSVLLLYDGGLLKFMLGRSYNNTFFDRRVQYLSWVHTYTCMTLHYRSEHYKVCIK